MKQLKQIDQRKNKPIISVGFKVLRKFRDEYQLNIKNIYKCWLTLRERDSRDIKQLFKYLQRKHGVIKPSMIPTSTSLDFFNKLREEEKQLAKQVNKLKHEKDMLKLQNTLLRGMNKHKHHQATSLIGLFKETLNWKSLPNEGSLLEFFKRDYFLHRGRWSQATDMHLRDMWKEYLYQKFGPLGSLLPSDCRELLEELFIDIFELEVKVYARYIGEERKKFHTHKETIEKELGEVAAQAWQTFKNIPKYGDRFSPYIPNNEQGVVFLFGRLHELLGFEKILHIQKRYPDCVATRSGVDVRIEFEFKSSGFQSHIKNGQVQDGDICICWKKDIDLPIETIELKSILKLSPPNIPM